MGDHCQITIFSWSIYVKKIQHLDVVSILLWVPVTNVEHDFLYVRTFQWIGFRMFKWPGRARENLPGGRLKYLFVFSKVRMFKCSYRMLLDRWTPPPVLDATQSTQESWLMKMMIYTYLYKTDINIWECPPKS